MAKNYIGLPVSGNRLAVALFGACVNLANAKDQLLMLKNAMDQMIDGSDYTLMETAFGIETGKGQTVYNLVAGSVSELASDVSVTSLVSYLAVIR